MIHLDDIQQGADFRNYPWQKLVNAVRRACNITVTPPLEMHQSWAGTAISLSLPRTHLFAARTTGSSATNIVLEESIVYGDRWKIALNATIHRRPDDDTVYSPDATNYEITVSQTGFHAFSGWVYIQHDNDDSQRSIWLEEADAGSYDVDATWTEVFGTKMWFRRLAANNEKDSKTFYVEHLLSAAKKYRIGVAAGYSSDPTVVTACEARLNIQRLRSE